MRPPISMVDGPARALDLIDALQVRGGLERLRIAAGGARRSVAPARPPHAAREAYLAATAATQLEPLRRLYARRLAELDSK